VVARGRPISSEARRRLGGEGADADSIAIQHRMISSRNEEYGKDGDTLPRTQRGNT